MLQLPPLTNVLHWLQKHGENHYSPNYGQKLFFYSFLAVFLLRYARVLTNIVGKVRYRPEPIPSNPTYHASDITVVLPTTDLISEIFHHVIQ